MLDRLRQLRSRNPSCPLACINTSHHLNVLSQDSQERYYQQNEGISQEFFQRIRTARGMILQVRDNNEHINELRALYAKAIKPSQEKEYSASLQTIVQQNRQHHENLKKLLLGMRGQIEQAEQSQQTCDEPETRMKRNFYLSLTNDLAKTLEQERIAQDSFKKCVKEKIARQVVLVDQNLTANQVDHYVNNPLQAQQMLQQRVYGMASQNLRNAVTDIQDKFRDIQRLERSVAECLQLFKQLAVLVQEQGALIDNIELNVNQTKDYVEKATVHLKKAKQHHKCTRKCLCIIIIIVVIALVVVLVPVIIYLKK